jgi:hypothetical protein
MKPKKTSLHFERSEIGKTDHVFFLAFFFYLVIALTILVAVMYCNAFHVDAEEFGDAFEAYMIPQMLSSDAPKVLDAAVMAKLWEKVWQLFDVKYVRSA